MRLTAIPATLILTVLSVAFASPADNTEKGLCRGTPIGSTGLFVAAEPGTGPELEHLLDLLASERFADVASEAERLLKARAPHTRTPRESKVFEARVEWLRGMAYLKLDDEHKAREALRASVRLGCRNAMIPLSALLHRGTQATADPLTRQALRAEAVEVIRSAAELADPDAIELLVAAAREAGFPGQSSYWLLVRGVQTEDGRERTYKFFTQHGTPRDRSFFMDVMREFSLSYTPQSNAPDERLCRSPATIAYVDLIMRRQLDFIWSYFFSEDREFRAPTLAESYRIWLALDEETPLPPQARFCLFIVGESKTDDSAMSIPRPDAMDVLLPGDHVLVQAGGRGHYAIVWSVDPRSDTVTLLDPFPEWWDPRINIHVSNREVSEPFPGRTTVTIPSGALQAMLVGFVGVRDDCVRNVPLHARPANSEDRSESPSGPGHKN